MENIESTIVELGSIFQELAHMVKEQEEQIQRLENAEFLLGFFNGSNTSILWLCPDCISEDCHLTPLTTNSTFYFRFWYV